MVCICNGVSHFFKSCKEVFFCSRNDEHDSLSINENEAVARARPLPHHYYGCTETTTALTTQVAQRTIPIAENVRSRIRYPELVATPVSIRDIIEQGGAMGGFFPFELWGAGVSVENMVMPAGLDVRIPEEDSYYTGYWN